MGCLGNSKTEDQRIDEKAQREANKKIEKQLQKERLAYKATHRLLLLGKEEGGCGGERGEEKRGICGEGRCGARLRHEKCRLLYRVLLRDVHRLKLSA